MDKNSMQQGHEDRFRALIDSGPTMVWTSGLDMLCDYFNQPWLSFTGRTLDQELGTGWLQNVHPDDQQRCMRTYTEAFKKRRRFRMTYRVRRNDGAYRWVEDRGHPRYDGNGVFVGFIGHCLDITTRYRAMQAVHRMKEKFRAIAEYTYDWESWLAGDGRLLWVSPSVLQHTGFTAQECFAMPDYPFGIVHEEDREGLARQFADALDARSSVNDLPFRVRCKDGRANWMSLSWIAIYSKDGQWLGMRISTRDMAERKRAEDEMAQLNAALALRFNVAERFLAVPEERLYGDILNLVLEAMASRYGYFGFIDENGDLVCPSMTRDIWEECRIPAKSYVFPKDAWGGLWGRSLEQKRSLLCNSELKPPAGHLPLQNALMVPLVVGNRLVGQIVVANKAGGYSPDDQHRLDALAAFIAPILSIHLDKERARQQLREHAEALDNKNIALNVLMDHRVEQKQQMADTLLKHFDRLVLPYLEKMEKTLKREDQLTYLNIIQEHIREGLSSLESSLSAAYRHLSPTEIQVADLVRAGKTSKEIAQVLHMSPRSVYFHRNNIRRKLNISNTKENLKSLLQVL